MLIVAMSFYDIMIIYIQPVNIQADRITIMKYYILTLKVIRLGGPTQGTDEKNTPLKPNRLVPELSK